MRSNQEIPKKVHLIWFGDKSKFIFDLDSLKEFMPNYTVKVWREEDFDWDELMKIAYVKKAYNNKNWAFLSDYLRVKILYEEGGVYLDADMKIIKNIEPFFFARELILAFENTTTLSMGICGAKKNHVFFKNLMTIYESYASGKFIIGNVIWDHIAKREMNARINGKHQETKEWAIYEYRKFSLIHPRYRVWKRKQQYSLHKHQVSWVPKHVQGLFKLLIVITQKITIINRLYTIILIWPKKEMKKNFLIKEG